MPGGASLADFGIYLLACHECAKQLLKPALQLSVACSLPNARQWLKLRIQTGLCTDISQYSGAVSRRLKKTRTVSYTDCKEDAVLGM